MSAWGKADNKSATGTVAITTGGAVTGTSTLFTTEAAVGDFLKADGKEFIIKTITSNTAATVINANPELGAFTAVTSGTSYTLSEKPISLASDPNTLSTNVYGVNNTELGAGGDNVVSVAIIQGGTGYVEAPTVTFSGGGGSSAAATATISGGAVTAVTMTNVGSSYETVPSVAIAAPRLTVATSGINTGTDTVTYTGHGLTTADAIQYNNGGSTSATGLTSGTTYYARVANADSFTIYDTAAHATAGGATGLIDISGTGNNAQYFVLTGETTATATAAKGTGETGTSASHSGWVKRTVGTGAHAGRIKYEVLVAMSKNGITSDAADDLQFPDA